MTAAIMASGSASANVGASLAMAVGFLLVNAVFVAYEFAVIAAKRATIEAEAEQGKASAQAALDSFRDLSVQLAGAQLGITMASLGLGWVGEPAVASVLESMVGDSLPHRVTSVGSLIIAFAVVVFLHLVIGEMFPKNIAIAKPEPTMRLLVFPYRAYLVVVRPLVFFLNALANLGCRMVGVEPRDELVSSHSASELADIVSHSSDEGAIESDISDLLRSALTFAELPVGEIARALSDDGVLRLGSTPFQAEAIVELSGQTRVPLFAMAAGRRRIEGYLHVKDLLRIPPSERHAPLPANLTRRMAVLQAQTPIIEALRVLRRTKRQMAVIVSPVTLSATGQVPIDGGVIPIASLDSNVDSAGLGVTGSVGGSVTIGTVSLEEIVAALVQGATGSDVGLEEAL